jgi:hypothetical protein
MASKKKAVKAKKKSVKAVRKPAGKKAAPAKPAGAKKAAPKKKKQTVGEGNYAASRAFDKDQAGFVKKNKARIPAMGKAAEQALEGPEGDALRQAEAAGLARSRDIF